MISSLPLLQPQRGTLDRLCDRLFLFGLGAAVLYVLWLPVFPSGDGPVHLYYADVLRSLIRHDATYRQDYAIRHLLAPYLVHYLAMIGFENFLSPAAAEKLFVAVTFITTAFGFRALARALGPHAGVACLWMLPLLFSWSLGGGFLNCCFATGIALFCWADWVRLGSAGLALRALARYALLLVVLVLSHPVPLLVLLLFTASDLLLQAASSLLQRGFRLRAHLPQLLAFALTAAAFVAPVLLAEKGQAAAVLPEIGFHRDVLFEMLTGMRLGLFAAISLHSVAGWLAILARALLVVIVPATAWLVLIGGRCQDSTASPNAATYLPHTAAGRLTLISVLYLAATVFFPRSLNHSYFFPQRMWDIVWLLIAACVAAAPLSRSSQRTAAGLGLLSIALNALVGLPALSHIARAQKILAAAPLPAGARGLFLEADSAEPKRGAATTYPVWFWAGARAFEASHAILLNSPWLGLTILPVRDADSPAGPKALLDRGIPSILSENPIALTHALVAKKSPRDAILARADFLLYLDPPQPGSVDDPATVNREALALVGDHPDQWRCLSSETFYAVCTKAR